MIEFNNFDEPGGEPFWGSIGRSTAGALWNFLHSELYLRLRFWAFDEPEKPFFGNRGNYKKYI